MMSKGSGRGPAEMPFLDHLEELRWRILWSLLALVISAGLGFLAVYKLGVIEFLKRPIDPYLENGKLIFLNVTDPFFITLQLAIALGFILASPVIFYHVWSFFSPALLPREKRAIVPALYLGVVLFFAGAALAYFGALPFTIRFMMNFQVASLEPQVTAGAYFSFVLRLLLGFGAVFEMPVVVMILAVMNVVTSKFLSSKRRYAFAVMAVVASMITPGDAITATVVMMLPLMLLYELSITLAKLVERGKRREAARAELSESAG